MSIFSQFYDNFLSNLQICTIVGHPFKTSLLSIIGRIIENYHKKLIKKTFHGNLNQDLQVCHCKIVIGKFVEISALVHSFGIKLAKESSYQ